MEANQKLAKLGKVRQNIIESNFLNERTVQDLKPGIYLFNENSMIDALAIDSLYHGRVNRQVVDLEFKTGNVGVLRSVELMKSNPNCTFFPGTLLRDFGSYVLPTMPVIQAGKLILERPKLTGIPFVDDYSELALMLRGKEYSEKVKEAILKGTPFCREPLKSLIEDVEQRVEKLRKNSLRAIDVNGLKVLPVICNEIFSIPSKYLEEPIDVTLHSSDGLFRSNEERIKGYEGYFAQMQKAEKLNGTQVLVAVENGENKFIGTLFYESGKLTEK